MNRMDDDRRKVYRGLGYAFIAIGVAVIAGYIAQRAFDFDFFSGDPTSVGLFLGLIGAALVYTVRQAGAEHERSDAEHGRDPE